MKDIQYLTNDKGEKVAVQIDLRRHGDLWEDVYDILIARSRSDEIRESLVSVKNQQVNQSDDASYPSRVHRAKITLRLPRQLVRKLRLFCALNDVNLQDLAEVALEAFLAGHSAKN